MNVSPNALRKETVELIRDIELQIDEVKKFAAEMGSEPHKLRSAHGWVMNDLLAAKATAYNTLVLLQEKK